MFLCLYFFRVSRGTDIGKHWLRQFSALICLPLLYVVIAAPWIHPTNRVHSQGKGLSSLKAAETPWGLVDIASSEPDGALWRTVGGVKGKDASGVGSQQLCTVRWNTVYPALLPKMKTCDKLASSTVSRELRSKIIQFKHRCFHITLNCCWYSEFSCFPCYDKWYGVLVNCNCVDTRWQWYSTDLQTEVRAMPRLCKFYPGICLTTEEKARKKLSQGSQRVLVYILQKRTHTHTHTSQKPHTYTHPHITKATHTHTHTSQKPHIHTPTHNKSHTYTHPHITKATHTHTHTSQNCAFHQLLPAL